VGNNVKDTTVYFNKLVKSDKQVVFDMEVSNVGGCGDFLMRRPTSGSSRSDEGRVLHAADGEDV
jgi:hypothetical protein